VAGPGRIEEEFAVRKPRIIANDPRRPHHVVLPTHWCHVLFFRWLAEVNLVRSVVGGERRVFKASLKKCFNRHTYRWTHIHTCNRHTHEKWSLRKILGKKAESTINKHICCKALGRYLALLSDESADQRTHASRRLVRASTSAQ
jgi:hypothetical protein